jgi:predicted Zn-dependent peptidase
MEGPAAQPTTPDARAIDNPTIESLDKIQRQDLIDFYKAYYRLGNSLLGVAGDISPDAAVAKLEKHIGAWESGTAKRPDLPLKGPLADKTIYLVDRPNSVQTQLILANRAIGRTDPDYIACMVMNRMLGQRPSARPSTPSWTNSTPSATSPFRPRNWTTSSAPSWRVSRCRWNP